MRLYQQQLHAFQAQANKRFSAAYSLLANFSWQKALDFGEFGTPTNQYNAHQDYGPADFDREYVFTLAHTVELPFGHGRKYISGGSHLVSAVVSNWAFRGITSYYSGLPFSPSIGNQAFLNSPDQTSRPDLVGNPNVANQTANLWFNPLAYGTPPLYTFGNAGRNSLRGPNFLELDWQLAKGFKLTERVGLELRWDVFNVINRQNLALPNNQVDSPAGGLITDIQVCSTCGNGMRNMQFGAHITF